MNLSTSSGYPHDGRWLKTHRLAALALVLGCSSALAEPFEYPPLSQPRGDTFVFTGARLGLDNEGIRYLTVSTTAANWQSFLDAIRPQHDDFAVWGYVPVLAADDWSLDLTGDKVTLVAPLDVHAVPYFSPTLARLVPEFTTIPSIPTIPALPPISPVPEPSQWALLALGMLAIIGWRARA